MPNKEHITEAFQSLQSDIISGLEALDGKGRFLSDSWERPGGGGGTARVLLEGNVIAKGGVNFSAVKGELPEMMRLSLKTSPEATFYATGVSIVLHPFNPMTPIIHMNVRYFEMEDGERSTYWFGGGIDLTPHYIDKKLASNFHQQLRATCNRFDETYYTRFKDWADNYFFIPHRNETRGVGGIFFDHLKEDSSHTKQDLFNFAIGVGQTFLPAYTEQVNATHKLPFGENELNWQNVRRGRYVEFNLVNDRGTKFGLETNGRTESILMSLPPLAGWVYDYKAEPGSQEAKTLDLLRKEIAW